MDARAAAEAAARRSYGKLVAILAARSGDVAGAEDALAEAFAAALRGWPAQGVPRNPEAWLLTVARRRQVDAVREGVRAESAAQQVALLADLADGDEPGAIPDDRLALLFACAHPALEASAHAPLMLQVVLGLDAAAVASAFLVSPAAMAQRLVRAKAKIREAGVPFRVPGRDELPARLDAVLGAIYAAYAEGWTDLEGADPRRLNLADEAIWLARLAASLLPASAEAKGLLSLMLYAQARRPARRDTAGRYVPLTQQDTRLWDGGLLEEAETLLRAASAQGRPGRYQLEAAVQSAHCVRRHGGAADWAAIADLYEGLHAITGSPVAALNRAVAIAHVRGPKAGWAELEALEADARLQDYQPYWAARADLLARSGRPADAEQAYQRAIGLERDEAVRAFLQARLASLR